MASYHYGNPWSNRSFYPYSYSNSSPRNIYPYSNPNPSPYYEATPMSKPRVVSIPVHYVNSDSPVMPPPAHQTAHTAQTAVVKPRRPSPEMAALRLQKVIRGFLVRKNVKTVRKMEAEAEEIGREIDGKEEVLERDEKSRISIGEMLMRLLFKLDSVRGVRDFRKKVIKKVISLQEKVDSIGAREDKRQEVEKNDSDPTEVESSNLQVDSDQLIANKMEETVNSTEETPVGADLDPIELVVGPMEETPIELMDSTKLSGMEGFREKSNLDEKFTEKVTESTKLDEELDKPVKKLNLEGELDDELPESIQEEGCKNTSNELEMKGVREVMERVVAESEKMKGLMEEICQRNVQQWRLMEGLADRVHRLERAVERMERREKQRKIKVNKNKCKPQWNSS